MRSLRVFFAIISLVVVVVATFGPSTSAVAYTSNLKRGDLAWYSRAGSGPYSGGAPTLRIVVLNVTGSTVYANFTNYFSDKYVNSTVFWVDYFRGVTSAQDLLFAAGTGLKIGDPAYDNSSSNIIDVQKLTCGGVQRNAGFATFTPSPGTGVRIYWDQTTGIMCNFFFQDSSGFQYITMSNTTLWSSTLPTPPDPFFTAIAVSSVLGIPLVILVVYAFFRRRRSRRFKKSAS